MGKVYRAEQSALSRMCALKLLVPDERTEADPDFFRRFSREAATAAKLTHPNSVTVFDYGKDDALGIYFIAMEYIAGRTLHRVLHDEGALPEWRVNRIAQQICRSLAEAHGLGLVHRDLKPSNVLLVDQEDEKDFVKVLDFGLVKDVSGQQDDLTQKGLFMGSPKYTAPEQVMGTDLTSRADIYSLGVCLYEMLTGKPPFDKKVNTATLMAHVNELPPPLSGDVLISPEMETLVMKCLEKHPDNRFASMRECLIALKAAAGEPVDASIPPRNSRSDRTSVTSQSSPSLVPSPTGSSQRPSVVLVAAGATASDSGSLFPPRSASLVDSLTPPQAPPTFTGSVVVAPNRSRLPTYALSFIAALLGGAIMLAFGRSAQLNHQAPPADSVALPIAVQATTLPGVETGRSSDFRIVRIESDPSGARVSDRGTEVCFSTPCRLVLQGAGIKAEYRLQLTKNGYKPATLVVRPEDETASTALEVNLGGGPATPAVEARSALNTPTSVPVPVVESAAPPARVQEQAPSALPPVVAMAAAAATTASVAPSAATTAAIATTAPTAAAPEIMRFKDGMARPVAISAPSVAYTREARQARVEGTVLARCVITTSGSLSGCRIVKGLPHMDQAVLSALAASRYRPILYEGRPVNVDYVFSLKLVLP